LKIPSLESFLATKPLFYAKIDYERMPLAWKSIEGHFSLPPIIHIIGTNGKGSTGRFLAHYLHQSGLRVGHYSSPHIMKFNERIWLDGKDADDRVLTRAHNRLYQLLGAGFLESLSFFEYTTLLAIVVFESCDYVVLEAGLGGEYDATSVFSNILTLVTPIDIDHSDFLGESIAEIATTKLNAIQKTAILATQAHAEVYDVSQKLMIKKEVNIFRSEQFFNAKELEEYAQFLSKKTLPDFFHTNLTLALSAVKFLGMDVQLSYLEGIVLFGRAQKIAENITIDVGHNVLAAKALFSHYHDKKIHLIYNTLADKEYEEILSILKPAIKIIEIIPILNERVEKKENLIKVIKKLKLPFKDFEEIDNRCEYLVFGSFSVVEAFLKLYGKRETTKTVT